MITSTSNQLIKNTKRLLEKKYRAETGTYLIEGEKLVREAIRFGQQIDYIICTEQSEFAARADLAVYTAEKFVVDVLCETKNAQGVVAVIKMPDTALTAPKGKCLILDGLQDAGNVGAIMRTAAATGYNDVYLADCVDAFSPKVLRGAMSAHFILNLHKGEIKDIFDVVLPKCEILCADMSGENVFKTKVSSTHAIVIGNEGNGVSEFSKSNASKAISLPMQSGFESLNAAVSASVLMYELTNKEI